VAILLASCAIPLEPEKNSGSSLKRALADSGGDIHRALDEVESASSDTKEEAPDGLKQRRVDLADRCLSHVLRGVLICLPGATSTDGSPQTQCHTHFARAVEEVRVLMGRVPGLEELLTHGGTPPPAARWSGLDEGDAAWLSCGASAAIWRSISSPADEEAALAIPVALRALTVSDRLDEAALFALSHWTRAVLFSQVPAALGGQPLRASKHFAVARRHGDLLAGFISALQARFLCPALQNRACFLRASERVKKAEMYPGLVNAAEQLLSWVEERSGMLFPNDAGGERDGQEHAVQPRGKRETP